MSASAITRWLVMVPLNDVRGAVRGAAIAVPARARPTVRATIWAEGATRRTALRGRVTKLSTPRPKSSAWPGSWPVGCGAAASIGGASGSRLHRCEIRLAPDTPSTVAWCILEKTTTWSPYPSITHISHSGRERSNGRPARWAVSSTSSS